MKKAMITLLLLPALVLLAHPVAEPLPIGSAMPKADVMVKDISGKELSLKNVVKENGVLVMFSCNTCPVVQGYQDRINEICKYTLGKNVGVILLNSNEGKRDDGDGFDDMKAYAAQHGFNWYYAVDKNNVLADAFGASRTPESFLFDKSGKLVYHGGIDDNPGDASGVKRRHLQEAVNEVAAGKDVSVKTTRSVGCGIKRVS